MFNTAGTGIAGRFTFVGYERWWASIGAVSRGEMTLRNFWASNCNGCRVARGEYGRVTAITTSTPKHLLVP